MQEHQGKYYQVLKVQKKLNFFSLGLIEQDAFVEIHIPILLKTEKCLNHIAVGHALEIKVKVVEIKWLFLCLKQAMSVS